MPQGSLEFILVYIKEDRNHTLLCTRTFKIIYYLLQEPITIVLDVVRLMDQTPCLNPKPLTLNPTPLAVNHKS